MKDYKDDSSTTLSRFGRDQRENSGQDGKRSERRPRLQRDAADSGNSNPLDHRPRRDDDHKPYGDRKPFADNKPYGEKSHGERRSYNPNFNRENRVDRPDGERRPYDPDRKPYNSDRKPYDPNRKPYAGPRPDGERRPYDPDRKPYDPNRKPYAGSRPDGERRPYDPDRKPYNSDRKPYDPNRKPYAGPRPDGERRPYDPDRKPYNSDRKPYDPNRKPYAGPRPDGERRPYDPDRKPYNSDRKPYDPNRKPFKRRNDDGPRPYPKYNPAPPTGEVRLNRFIAQSGLCSRREADEMITAGLVTVNGAVVTVLGTKIQPTDEVKYNDSKVEGEKKVYLVLNKPKGYVTTLDDPHAEKTVMDLVKGACTERVYPVGRLDKNSLGLLLFTNDGDLTRQLTHPSFEKKKVYQVTIDKPLTRADMEQIVAGITLDDGEIHADEVAYVKEDKEEIGIEIHSGRNRIVRRIFEHLGYTVKKLDRVYYAGLSKKNLKRGQWRFLSREEVERLKSGRYE